MEKRVTNPAKGLWNSPAVGIWMYIIISVFLGVLSVSLSLRVFNDPSWLNGVDYPVSDILNLLLAVAATIMFILKKDTGWYMVSAFFIFYLFAPVAYSLYLLTANFITVTDLPAGEIIAGSLALLGTFRFFLLAVICTGMWILLFNARIKERIFHIRAENVSLRITAIIIIYALFLWILPMALK